MFGNYFFYLLVSQFLNLDFVENFKALSFELQSGVGFLFASDYDRVEFFPLIFGPFQILRVFVSSRTLDHSVMPQRVHMGANLTSIACGNHFGKYVVVDAILANHFLELLDLVIVPSTVVEVIVS